MDLKKDTQKVFSKRTWNMGDNKKKMASVKVILLLVITNAIVPNKNSLKPQNLLIFPMIKTKPTLTRLNELNELL